MADEDVASGALGSFQYPNLEAVSEDEARRVFALMYAYVVSHGTAPVGELVARAAAVADFLKTGAVAEPERKPKPNIKAVT